MAEDKPSIKPSFETKEWIPPDLRPKKKRIPNQKKYQKPEGITQKLEISSLVKIWYNYYDFEDRQVLLGSYSETHKRFSPRSNGYQTPCNCIMAVVFAQFMPMKFWQHCTIDNVLIMGNELYINTIQRQPDRTKTYLLLCEVYPSFFYRDTKITITLKGNRHCGKMFEDIVSTPCLASIIVCFFEEHCSGILTVGKRHFALWTTGKKYYFFDPSERDCCGLPWRGLRGRGYATVMRFKDLDKLVCVAQEGFDVRENPKCVLTPCSIIRMVKILTCPPPPQCCFMTPHCPKPLFIKQCPPCPSPQPVEEPEPEIECLSVPEEFPEDEDEEEEDEEVNEMDVNDEYAPEVGILAMTPSEYERKGMDMPEIIERNVVSESQIPKHKPRAESVTYFGLIIPCKVGILRGSTHQADACYTLQKGKQSVCNCMMSLAMLRHYKSREWFKKMVDDTLKYGERYYGQTIKHLPRNTEVTVSNVSPKLCLYDIPYRPIVEEFTAIGRLKSNDVNVLDLQPALEEFFRCFQTCIITGPLIVAAWLEDGLFYMFDPNERDHKGQVVVKSLQVGSEMQVLDFIPGVACVTWFSDLKLLVEMYMNNIEPKLRREPFIISKIMIQDFEYTPENWFNFLSMAHCRWILSGTFNQNDRRFDKNVRNTQSTAAAAIALAMAFIKPIKDWDTADVDEVLITADEYYTATVEALKECNAFHDPKLLVGELLRKFIVDGNEVTFEIRDCIVNGVIEGSEELVLDLAKGLHIFFKENNYGILTCRDISVAVWKSDQIYYYYDSHSRDKNGLRAYFGTACILRLVTVDDLVRVLMANFKPSTENMYNISGLEFVVWKEDPDGGWIKPPLHNYKELNAFAAILHAISSEISPRFGLNAGKQTIPMCLVAVAMMKLYPSNIWTVDVMEEILTLGDRLYIDTMIEREKKEDLAPEDDIDEVYAENCLLDFYLGMNKITVEYGTPITGNFEYHLQAEIIKFYSDPTSACGGANANKELFITSDFYNVVTWYDGSVYYLFDPKPRNQCGEVFGKDEWSARFEEAEEGDAMDGLDKVVLKKLGRVDQTQEMENFEEGEDGQRDEIEEPVITLKHSLSYWREQELKKGTAVCLWFLTPDQLAEYVYENNPPNRRPDLQFKLYPITVIYRPELKRCFDPLKATREDNYEGDWYEFKEVDYGRWILRGTFNNTYIMFPEHNRGKQQLAMCYTAFGYVKRFAISCFSTCAINDVLKYGDRLYSATRLIYLEDLRNKKCPCFTTEEIEEILNRQQYGVQELIRAFCIGLDQMQIFVTENVVSGDINASDDLGVLNVPRALEVFFNISTYGILTCRNLTVAIWRGVNVFYMFDSNSNGPCGLSCPGGEACITRYLKLETMCEVFLHNLEKEGNPTFAIHMVKVRYVPCPRPLKPEERECCPEPAPRYTGFTSISPGKCILRGTLNQDNEIFGRGQNMQAAAIAIIALTMSLVHKPYTWTVPIVDDILFLGDELYAASLEKLGYEFNPWEQGLPVTLVNKDYKIGSLRANFEVRCTDQRGVINIKHPRICNLRQGIDHFFEENSYGVIETETLTVAIWEEEEQPGFIYMYDPNQRGPAGLYSEDGSACMLIFETSKLAAEHFSANITDSIKRTGEFVITPVEIVVGNVVSKCTRKLKECNCENINMANTEPKTICDKRKLRYMAEQERKRKEKLRLAKIGRNDYYVMPTGDAILRGTKSQCSKQYSENSRGYQDIPNCFAAFVVHRLSPVNTWHYKHIDMILDVGDQLYKDSYITYCPKNRKLGMTNVFRKVFIKEVQVTLEVYKPVMCNTLSADNLELALVNYFQQEQFGILCTNRVYVGLFFKEGYYYMFVPHERDVEGNIVDDCMCEQGVACVLKFPSITNMVNNYIENTLRPTDLEADFYITVIAVGSIIKKGEKAPCCLYVK